MITCRVFEGLGNRINAIASAMTTGCAITVFWAVNSHCPAPSKAVFKPIENLKFVDQEVATYNYIVNKRELCWFYPRNIYLLPVDVFRRRLHKAYRTILESFQISTWAKPSSNALGLHYRSFLADTDTLKSFLASVTKVSTAISHPVVHVASDCSLAKQQIVEHMEGLGVAASVNSCRLMNHDLDRSLLSVFGMCRDLRSLACCNLGVVTNSSQSTVVDSLRGFGVQAYHTFDGGFRTCGDRDDLAEGSPVQSLIDKHKIGS